MVFRINSKHVFLTYAQCPLTKDELYLLLSPYNISEWVIAKENHADGSPHLHAFLTSSTKFNTQSERFFDIKKDNIVYHPNIQSNVRSVKNVVKYIKKDGEFMASPGLSGDLDNIDRLSWGEMLVAATDKKSFMQLARRYYPREYALNYDRLSSMAEQEYKTQMLIEPIIPPLPFNVPEELTHWTENVCRLN